jgi:hypothetical protein
MAWYVNLQAQAFPTCWVPQSDPCDVLARAEESSNITRERMKGETTSTVSNGVRGTVFSGWYSE